MFKLLLQLLKVQLLAVNGVAIGRQFQPQFYLNQPKLRPKVSLVHDVDPQMPQPFIG
jgi:hypothetical protein